MNSLSVTSQLLCPMITMNYDGLQMWITFLLLLNYCVRWPQWIMMASRCVYLIFIFHFGRQSTITIIIVRAQKLHYKFILFSITIWSISNQYFHDFCLESWMTFHPCSEKNITFNTSEVFIINFGCQTALTIIVARDRKLPYKFLLPETKIMTVAFSFEYFDFSQVSRIC